MSQIIQYGTVNTTALVVPDLYVQIVPPQTLFLNGVPTNVIGMVGTATWGPVNHPTIVGNAAEYVQNFGTIQTNQYDMGTHVYIAIQQGASNFRCVRVTDGTDAAATIAILTTCLTVNAKYTGSAGNNIAVTFAKGSAVNTHKVTISPPISSMQPEVFDNIQGAANAFWVNVANAINNGNSPLRGPSKYVTATAGAGTTAVALSSYALTGGTDGSSGVDSADMMGIDSLPRTGMYALHNTGVSVIDLCDLTDSTTWTTQASFGLSEGAYMIATGASGLDISNGTTGIVDIKATAGLDSYAVKLMHGDWIYWNDPQNQVLRLVSPQAFVAGELGNLSPQNSTLNKQLFSVAGSQKSGVPGTGQFQTYATADLQELFQNGIDVICNPQPGGSYWGVRCGHNSSSLASVDGDNYTRMTNYIASTIAAGMGVFVGALINTTLYAKVRATLNNFFQGLLSQGLLALNDDGSLPWSVVCDSTNNPPERTGLGYLQADVQVRYQAIVEKFIVNLEGGQTVSVVKQSTATTISGS